MGVSALLSGTAAAQPWIRITNDPASSTAPDICGYGGTGDLSIVWIDQRTGAGDVYFTRVDPSGVRQLAQDVRVSTGSALAHNPDCGVDAAGNTAVVWEEGNITWYAKLNSTGATVVAPRQLFTNTAGNFSFPRIDLEANGTGHVAHARILVSREVWYRVLDPSGNQTCARIVESDISGGDNSEYPYIVAPEAAGGSVRMSWRGYNFFGNKPLRATSPTCVSSPLTTLIDNLPSTGRTALADSPGLVLFEGVVSGQWHVLSHQALNSHVRVDQGAGSARDPGLAALSAGDALATWEDRRSGTAEIYARGMDGVTKQPAGSECLVSAAGTASQRPAIERAGPGYYAVVWDDLADGQAEIYLRFVGSRCGEICNGIDDDGNGDTDEGCDDDGDDYCDESLALVGASPACPSGGGDCNDASPAAHPGAAEACDGLDNDCEAATAVDGGCDDDGDDYCERGMAVSVPYPPVCPSGGGDCRDDTSSANPGILGEVCGDLDPVTRLPIDNDCDDDPDGFDTDCASALSLRLVGLEVNQAVQDWNNSVPLVSGKRTMVRAHVEAADPNSEGWVFDATLAGYRGGLLLGTLSPANAGGGLLAKTAAASRRHLPESSLNFELPREPGNDWTQGDMTFVLATDGAVLDCTNAAPVPWTPACQIQASFTAVPPLQIRVLRIRAKADGNDYAAPSISEAEETARNIEAILPVSGIQWTIDKHETTVGIKWWVLKSGYMQYITHIIDNSRPWGSEEIWLALVGRTWPLDAQPGFAQFLEPVCGAIIDMGGEVGSFGRTAAAHELGHALGRPHACHEGLVDIWRDGYCDEKCLVGQGVFPYMLDVWPGVTRPVLGPSIDPNRLDTVSGIDTSRSEGPSGFSATRRDENFELMSYCGRRSRMPIGVGGRWQWPSKFTYEGMRGHLTSSVNRTPAGQASTLIADYELVEGFIEAPVRSVHFDPLRVVTGAQVLPDTPPGPYRLRVLDDAGVVLDEVYFGPELHWDEVSDPNTEGSGMFSVPVILRAESTEYQVWDSAGVIGSRRKTSSAPTVRVVYPNGGEQLTGSSVTLEWEGADADEDPLSYEVEWSVDGGATWNVLVSETDTQAVDVDLSALPGSTQSRIRVTVRDGALASSDESDGTFVVPRRAPRATIHRPADGSEFSRDQSVVLNGTGVDAEDGILAGTALSWTSDLDGALGTGSDIVLFANQMSEGVHTLTLSAQDGDGQGGSTSVLISISRASVPTNGVPVAFAGADRSVACTGAGGTQVMLDGTGSSDPDGDALSYSWHGSFPEGGGTVPGSPASVTLPLGVTSLLLAVDDGYGGTSTDAVEISVLAVQEACDGIDNDCNGLIDDGAGQSVFRDADGDGFGDPAVTLTACSPPPGFVVDGTDCLDSDGEVWGSPGEVLDLECGPAPDVVSWQPPMNPGGTTLRFDVLRVAGLPSDFMAAECVESDDDSDLTATDVDAPPIGSVHYYLVRAENSCPATAGIGPLGDMSDGTPRTGRVCP